MRFGGEFSSLVGWGWGSGLKERLREPEGSGGLKQVGKFPIGLPNAEVESQFIYIEHFGNHLLLN